MIQRVYIDTSVIGGYFDEEFEFYTKLFFEKVEEGKFKVILSDILKTELQGAPESVVTFFKAIPHAQIEYVDQTEDSIQLGEEYLNEGVVGKTSRTDCRHIALATLVNADILVSWNFKHIVNINRIRGYNSVNIKHGHRILEIRTPREILEL
jgi:predicted nucleic acid-binding protein